MNNSDLKRKLSELLDLKLVDWPSTDNRIEELHQLKRNLENLEKKPEYSNFLKMIKALSHPVRISILLSINNGVTCPCELEFLTGLAQATISHHLTILEGADLVIRDRKGKWTLLKSSNSELLDSYFSFG